MGYYDRMVPERRVFTMAQKHIVTCRACGNQFDTFRGGYYNSNTRLYTCRRCGRRGEGHARGIRIGMRQTVVGMVLKLLFGALFLAVSCDTSGDWDWAYFFICIIFGGALIRWAVLPWVKARQEQAALFLQDSESQAIEAAEKKKAAPSYAPRVCPGCGATGTGKVCEYCGTRLR